MCGLTSVSRADDDWAKASIFCEAAGKLLAAGKIDEVKANIAKASNDLMTVEDLGVIDAPAKKFFGDGKNIDGPHLLAEKSYGDNVADFAWFLMTQNGT